MTSASPAVLGVDQTTYAPSVAGCSPGADETANGVPSPAVWSPQIMGRPTRRRRRRAGRRPGRVVLAAGAAGDGRLRAGARIGAVDVEVAGAVVGPVDRRAVDRRGAGVARRLRHLLLLQHPRGVAAGVTAEGRRESEGGNEQQGRDESGENEQRDAERPHAGRGMRLQLVPPIDAPPQRVSTFG